MVIAALVLVVRLYDAVGLPPADRDAARVTASAILGQAGVVLDWRDCGADSRCGSPAEGGAVIVRIVVAPKTGDAGSLGFSFVDAEQQTGVLPTVFADRVYAVAGLAGSSRTELLGRVIAHEIAHTLLGITRHAASGLMRAVWSTADLQRNAASDWTLSSRERGAIRRGVLARLRAAQPAAVVAANDSHRDSERDRARTQAQ